MTDVDLLVAGAGGGLAGALRAAELGQRVLVVDADRHHLRGNNTAMSTAMIPGAGSRYQRAAGIDDSPACFLADIERKTRGTAEPAVARALAEVSAELVEWLADHVGLPLELATDVHYPGHAVPRVHTVPGRHGSRLLAVLSEAARRHDLVDLLVPCRLTDLHPDGDAIRAVLRHPGGDTEEVTAGAALLATNGYGANAELVRHHLPEIAAATYHGGEHSTGDALRIGSALGARTACLDAYQGHAGLSATARTLVTWTTIMHGGFLVNRDGRRFGDETSGYSEYASVLAAQPGATGWIVFDLRIHELSTAFVDYKDAVEAGAVHTADTAEDLAAAISVPAGALRAELAEAAAVAGGERDRDRFGRTGFEAALAPPLRAVRVLPALFHTQGGLVVDDHARVLSQDGEPITGVYASGGAAVGISGRGTSGYLGGNGLLPALGLAYLAAAHAAGLSDGGEHR
ncbi:FAD-dependent oxidoreductase [Pseudonocardia acaciae]|uniref:FAD-dependent oxidoreductase n=1 Tax=Pseudonocardia acaciae TaxID=551276 RepID=UPI000491707E|nr:FAD-binding protein [Pseudonocardia acaciae]